MPILGPLAVINRVEQAMQEGFLASVRVVEADLVVDGALLASDPVAPIPTDEQYFRHEEGALEVRQAVVVRANESFIINDITNMGDVHWQHEIMVEVHKVLDGTETFEQLQSMIYRYGAALVLLFGAVRPSLEVGGGSANNGAVFPDVSNAGGGNWPDHVNILLLDGVFATTVNRAVQNFIAPSFPIGGFVPADNFFITGMSVSVVGICEDADLLAREIDVRINSGTTPFPITSTLTGAFTASASANTVTLGSTSELWGLEQFVPSLWTGDGKMQVRVEAKNKDAGYAAMSLDSVSLIVHYKELVPYDGTTVVGVGPVKYRDRFDEAGAFINRSATITLEVQRREING